MAAGTTLAAVNAGVPVGAGAAGAPGPAGAAVPAVAGNTGAESGV
ncbi:hypothetical protein T567_04085, partial [Mycobacterium tuberculosis UT0022]